MVEACPSLLLVPSVQQQATTC